MDRRRFNQLDFSVKITLNELMIGLCESYGTVDTPIARKVLSERHQFPVDISVVRDWYGKECVIDVLIQMITLSLSFLKRSEECTLIGRQTIDRISRENHAN